MAPVRLANIIMTVWEIRHYQWKRAPHITIVFLQLNASSVASEYKPLCRFVVVHDIYFGIIRWASYLYWKIGFRACSGLSNLDEGCENEYHHFQQQDF
jgi:hypothetical protein